MTKDVSVIIPVYNASRFLATCLDSLLAQTFDHARMEILLIDDGSDDGSEAVCDKYAAEHPGLFLVTHCAHTGSPGAVRNVGMRQAVGEYILFSDADDWWGNEAVERLVRHAAEWDSDMIQGRMCDVINGKIKGINKYFNSNKSSMPVADWRTFQQLTSTLGSIRMFKRSVALENDVWWDDESWFEDTQFSLKLIFASEVCSIANDYNYYYVRRSDDNQSLSTTQKKPTYIKRPENIVRSVEKLFDLYDEQGVASEEGHFLLCKLLRHQVITGSEIVIEQVALEPDAYENGAAPFLRQIWERAERYYTEDVKPGLSLEVRCALEGLAVGKSLDELRPLRCMASCGRLPKEVVRAEARAGEDAVCAGGDGTCSGERAERAVDKCAGEPVVPAVAPVERVEGLEFLSDSTFEEFLLRQLSNVTFGMIHRFELSDGIVRLSGDVFFPLFGTREVGFKVFLEAGGGKHQVQFDMASINYECHGDPFQARGVWTAETGVEAFLDQVAKAGEWDVCFEVTTGALSRCVSYSKQKLSALWCTEKGAAYSFELGQLWCGLLPDAGGTRRIGFVDHSAEFKEAPVKKKSVLRRAASKIKIALR